MSSLRSILVIAVAIVIVSCGMLPMEQALYEYRAATHDVTVTVDSWPDDPATAGDPFPTEADVVRIWIYALVDGPPEPKILDLTPEPEWYESDDEEGLPEGVFLGLDEDLWSYDPLPDSFSFTIGDVASHFIVIILAETMDGDARFYRCFASDGGSNYTVSMWWHADSWWEQRVSYPLPDFEAVISPATVTDLAAAGGNLFVAPAYEDSALLVIDAETGSVEQYSTTYGYPYRIAADTSSGTVYVAFRWDDWVEVFDLETRTFGTPLELPLCDYDLKDLEYMPTTGALAILRYPDNHELLVRDPDAWASDISVGEVNGDVLAVNDSTQTAFTLHYEWGTAGEIRSYDYGSGASLVSIEASSPAYFGPDLYYSANHDLLLVSTETDGNDGCTLAAFDPDTLTASHEITTLPQRPPFALVTPPDQNAILMVAEDDEWVTTIALIDIATGDTLAQMLMPETETEIHMAASPDWQTIMVYGNTYDPGMYADGQFHVIQNSSMLGGQ